MLDLAKEGCPGMGLFICLLRALLEKALSGTHMPGWTRPVCQG